MRNRPKDVETAIENQSIIALAVRPNSILACEARHLVSAWRWPVMSTKKMPTASISKLIFSGGQHLSLAETEKVILVGPNNSGKSQSLRDIVLLAKNGKKHRPLVVSEVEFKKSGSSVELRAFLEEKAAYNTGNYNYKDWVISSDAVQFWDQNYLQHQISGGFIKNIDADSRLNICKQQQSISPGDQKSKPQHVMYDDEDLMSKVSSLFKKAFGKDIMFDFRGGKHIPIHVGELPNIKGSVDRVGNAYVAAVRQNPSLDQQGDGMKGYAGILFEAVVSDLNITLIDEPEAFLHPPQMRKLGETLASDVKGQLIVATHSSDILRGFLEGAKGNVRIVRIQRFNDKNLIKEASNSAIKELWERPELRYSNALDGIFHEQVIICEDDSDCRLINSMADYLSSNSKSQWRDTAYVPTGGKHGIPKVASVLREIGVPVKAIFDIDFLAEKPLVEAAVEAFGGSWAEIEPLWSRVDAAVRAGVKPKTVSEIKSNLIELITKAPQDSIPKSDIREALKQGQSWNQVKRFGSKCIPRGDSQVDYEKLRLKLEEIGIFCVQVGEMENFYPEIGAHGPKFVTKLLSSVPLSHRKLSELRAFVKRIHLGATAAPMKGAEVPATFS